MIQVQLINISRAACMLCFLFVFTMVGIAQEDEERFGNKYFYKRWDTLSLNERRLPPGSVIKMRQDKDFWYMDSNSSFILSERQSEKQSKKAKEGTREKTETKQDDYVPLGRRNWFQVILWIVILGGFSAFLAFYLAGSNVGLFRKKNIRSDNRSVEDQMPEDIFAISYQKEIDKAVGQGNYRLAVRLQFLRLLKIMSDKNLIRYTQDKTNFDYLMELQPTSFYSPFFRATRNYEYSWYGLFPVSNESYQTIKKDFDSLHQQLA